MDMKEEKMKEDMMEDDEAVLDLKDAFEENFHVNASPLKKFEPAIGRFEDVLANAMMFKQNPEAGTLTGEKDDEMLKSVNHVMEKIEQPLDDRMEEDFDKPSKYSMTNVSLKGWSSLVGRLSSKSTKTTNNDRVTKRSSTRQNTYVLSNAGMTALGSMVDEMQETKEPGPEPEPTVALNSSIQKPHVLPGIVLRHIDEDYEFDEDDNEIVH